MTTVINEAGTTPRQNISRVMDEENNLIGVIIALTLISGLPHSPPPLRKEILRMS